MESQNDITNLIPKGLGAYWFLFLGCGTVIVLLEFAYFKMPSLAEQLGLTTIPPLDVSSRGSLLNWCLSVLLLVTAIVSLINFQLGLKYKDQRTNTWFWTAVALIFLSLDVQTAVRETVRDVLTAVSGTSLYRDGTVWWLILYSFFFGILGTRLLLNLISYAPSLGLYLLAVSGMLLGSLVEIGFIPIFENPTQNTILQTAIPPAIALFFFLALTLFARRQIFRDSETALRWFRKVWQQTPIPAENQSPPKESKPVTAPSSTASQQPATPATPAVATPVATTTALSGTSSAVSRPLVQKPTVPFKSTDKDDDFDLADSA
ncbi:MAG: hypothetical protein LBQ50_03590 [Planctomycetaceae bacterium]|jgi:hypothetical protein|nr:hypothetical protein [Planctomycetaceae bacterium]